MISEAVKERSPEADRIDREDQVRRESRDAVRYDILRDAKRDPRSYVARWEVRGGGE